MTGGHSEGDGFAAIFISEGDGFAAIFISLDIESCWGDDSCISDGDGIAAISGVGLLPHPFFVSLNETLLSNEILAGAGTVEFTVVDSAVAVDLILLFNLDLVLFCSPPCVCNSRGSG